LQALQHRVPEGLLLLLLLLLLLHVLLWVGLLLVGQLLQVQQQQQQEWVVPHRLLQQTGAVSSLQLLLAVAAVLGLLLVLLCDVARLLQPGHVVCLQLRRAWGLVVHLACAAQTAAAALKHLHLLLLLGPQLAVAVAIKMLQDKGNLLSSPVHFPLTLLTC
jgi:hypothetical protein